MVNVPMVPENEDRLPSTRLLFPFFGLPRK